MATFKNAITGQKSLIWMSENLKHGGVEGTPLYRPMLILFGNKGQVVEPFFHFSEKYGTVHFVDRKQDSIHRRVRWKRPVCEQHW